MVDEITAVANVQRDAAEMRQAMWYERDFTLDSAMGMIRGRMLSAVQNYVAVGFYLKAIRDRRLFEEDGYNSFGDFVRDRIDKNKT